jgi:hypothetical protein
MLKSTKTIGTPSVFGLRQSLRLGAKLSAADLAARSGLRLLDVLALGAASSQLR